MEVASVQDKDIWVREEREDVTGMTEIRNVGLKCIKLCARVLSLEKDLGFR